MTATTSQTQYVKDLPNKKITVTRDFNAPVATVWRAWTEKELLEQWWAPRPWRAETVSMDFKEGGRWHYAMVGPDGTKIYALMGYKVIKVHDFFTALDAFADEKGNINPEFPNNDWKNSFHKNGTGTKVIVELTFASEADLHKMVEMGFQEGFAMAHDNLDELLKTL
ncbi:MAG TPA: SRPBCC domain-containing protein [Puia sp.]